MLARGYSVLGTAPPILNVILISLRSYLKMNLLHRYLFIESRIPSDTKTIHSHLARRTAFRSHNQLQARPGNSPLLALELRNGLSLSTTTTENSQSPPLSSSGWRAAFQIMANGAKVHLFRTECVEVRNVSSPHRIRRRKHSKKKWKTQCLRRTRTSLAESSSPACSMKRFFWKTI